MLNSISPIMQNQYSLSISSSDSANRNYENLGKRMSNTLDRSSPALDLSYLPPPFVGYLGVEDNGIF